MSTANRSPPARVSALRTLSLVLAFTAAVGLIFGTAGFTAMSADRGLAVNVTDDENAYLGYEPVNDTVRDGEPTEIVEYRNQFRTDLEEFDVNVSSDHDRVTVEPIPQTLGEGDGHRVVLTIRCDAETEVTLEFDADGRGNGVSVSLDRTHTVTCVPTGPTVTGVTFNDGANAGVETESAGGSDERTGNDENGNGDAAVHTDRGSGEVTATVWLAPNPRNKQADGLANVSFDGDQRLDTSGKVRPQVNRHSSGEVTPGSWKIAAIEFPDQNVTYLHPGWDAGVHDDPSSGEGVEYEGSVDDRFLLNATVEGDEVVLDEND